MPKLRNKYADARFAEEVLHLKQVCQPVRVAARRELEGLCFATR